ncbi:MAG: AMP-binding protein [Steroidobacteraceae bacterium]
MCDCEMMIVGHYEGDEKPVNLAAAPMTHTAGILSLPTTIYRLLDIPDLNKKVDLSSLKYFFYGAAPMSVEKLKLAIDLFGPVMTGGYGQTEAPGTISNLPPGDYFTGGKIASDERLSSVGKPNPLVRVEMTRRQRDSAAR